MKKTNRVFLFVLGLLFGLLFLVWQSIQTEKFGSILSSRLSSYVSKKYEAKVSFEKVEFSFFPVSTELVNFELEYQDYFLSSGKVGLTFGWRDIFSKEFSIGSVFIKDALIYLPETKKNQNEKTDFAWSDGFKLYKEQIRKQLPFNLRGVELVNTIVNVGDERVEAISAKLSLFPNILTIDMSIGFDEDFIAQYLPTNLKKVEFNGFSGQLQITSNYVRLKEARILSENSYLQLSGKVFYNESFQGLTVDSFLDLNKFKKLIPDDINPKILPSGAMRVSGVIDGSIKNPKADIQLKGTRLNSEVYRFSTLQSDLFYEEGRLILKDALGFTSGGTLKLTEKVEIFNTEIKDFTYPDFFIDANKIFTNNLLFFLPKLDPVKSFISGPVKLTIKKDRILLKTFEGFRLNNFSLVNENSGKDILKNDEYFLSPGSILNVSFNGDVNVDAGIGFKNSLLQVTGGIKGDQVNVKVNPSQADLFAFGPISGVVLKGTGGVVGTIMGAMNDPQFNFTLTPRDAELLDIKLGSIKTNLSYGLKSSRLSLNNLSGVYKGMEYSGQGVFNFDEEKPMNLSFRIFKGSWNDAKESLYPIFKPIIPYLKNAHFNMESSVLVTGGFDVHEMNVKGDLLATNFLWFSEDIEKISTDFTLNDSLLSFNNIRAQKVSGNLFGKGRYNLKDKEYSYEGSLTSLRLKDVFYYRLLNLGLDGDVFAEFNGYGNDDDFSSRTHFRLINSVVDSTRLKDSILTVYNNKDDLFFSTSGLGGEVKMEGFLNLNQKKKKLSSLTMNVDTDNIRNLAGIISKHNINKSNLEGRIQADMVSDFDLDDLSQTDLRIKIDTLSASFPGVRIEENQRPYLFEIKKGVFENWDQEIKGKGFELKTKAVGNLKNRFDLSNKFKFNSSIVELITDFVEKSDGEISGVHNVFGNAENLDHFMNIEGDGISLKAKNLPGLFSDIKVGVHFEDDVVLIDKLTGRYGNGKVKGSGKLRFTFPFPKLNLSMNVEKTRFPILKKSGVVVSGDMTLKGEKLPYQLKGNLAVIQGEVIDSMNDLASSAASNDSYQRFIPVGYLEGNVSFINTDISVTSFSPVQIKNGMIDMGLGGNINVFGSILSPKFSGRLEIENPENKFLFKGHEFLLSEGEIKLLDGVRKEPPELRFNGVTRINDYDIFVSVAGPSDKMNVEMSSNPPLAQADILSLLTLGVTSDVSKNLGDRQRQSVTTLSIGTLLIDQLRINQSLNDSLGVRVSIQPEFIEDENNLLEGRVEDRNGGSRFRSQTVLKVQKRINKKMNLSLSSTVGGSVDQSQEMNLNYKINKSWSLEGVYEVRSNDELEQELPDSKGVDIKYQWSF